MVMDTSYDGFAIYRRVFGFKNITVHDARREGLVKANGKFPLRPPDRSLLTRGVN